LRARGNLANARRLYEEALDHFRALGQRLGVAGCLYDLAIALAADDDHSAAETHLAEALSLYKELNHKPDIPRVLDIMAECALATADEERAIVLAAGTAAMRRSLHLGVTEAVQDKLDATLDAARARLTSTHANACWMAGWRMPVEELTEYALRRRKAPGSGSR
jgi:tetratricopeptide (TPR) repeat protein